MSVATKLPQRRTRRNRRKPETGGSSSQLTAFVGGPQGGTFRPLSDADVEQTHRSVLAVLEQIGIADPIPELRDIALDRGCTINKNGRLCFPGSLIEELLSSRAREFSLCGKTKGCDMVVSDRRVHFLTGGGAVSTVDFKTQKFRPSTLHDIYDLARLVDCCENIDGFFQLTTATEIPDLVEQGVNMAYASFAGTAKHVRMNLFGPEQVLPIAQLCHMIAGGRKRFRERPFGSVVSCSIVSPLRFGEEQSQICVEAIREGIPIFAAAASQAGATAPAALSGALVQTIAETIAAYLQVKLFSPEHPVVFTPLPLTSDLRSGACSTGGGEVGVLMSAAAQMAVYYGLPCSVVAGASDSKVPDAQAGYEKGVNCAMAGLAGANFLTHSSGMLATGMGASFEALAIDNDMLGNIRRAIRGIEVTDEKLSLEIMAQVTEGPGHYLGEQQTLDLMKNEFAYPTLGDRESIGSWQETGSLDHFERARNRVSELLSSHYPSYIHPDADAEIRDQFQIHLRQEDMRQECARW